MSIKNQPAKKGRVVSALRGFYEHRAIWMYLLCDEARRQGLDPAKFAPAAIRRCGLFHGRRALDSGQTAAGKSLKRLKKKLFKRQGRMVFEMDFKNCTDDCFEVEFHYCPLVAAWQKQGCGDEEIGTLCDWAMEGDRGIAEAFDCELSLPKTIARGDDICQIRIERKG
ncbi:MAG: L-2-amino-thiazoline-4-carboxylic acid hydrolase [Treponema sp.]|jgi:hypothetical protein|nr:L-2-amino-thiazoline-4-carboxylic acid hydrolase [Treponema sp.]